MFFPERGQDSPSYQLIAAVVHAGVSAEGGHYYVYARDVSNSFFLLRFFCVRATRLGETLGDDLLL